MKQLNIGVLDFFCGCGGASSGFVQARVPGVSFHIVAGIDNDPSCCATFTRMHQMPAHQLDIVGITDSPSTRNRLIREWHLERFDRVVLIGCSPCQGFAAHRKSKHGRDARRSLFTVFCELVGHIKPDAVFLENVPDLLSKKHWSYYAQGRHMLEAAGYTVRTRIYNLAGFGLPQERFRTIMLAFPRPFNMPVPPLSHTSFRTVRDAIGHLPLLRPGDPCASDPMLITSRHRQSTLDILARIPLDGGNRPVGVGPKCLDRARAAHGGYTDVYGRMAWDRPSVTITARCRTPSCGRFAHPEQNRGLSVREAALLQGFPPDYVFEGPFDDKFKQIGNAVPPLVAKVIAEHIGRVLLSERPITVLGLKDDVSAPVGPGFAVTINAIKKKRSVQHCEARN